MNKKYAVIALIIAFLMGATSLGLCLTDKHHEHKSNCCSDKTAPVSATNQDCLWHCASKKLVGTNTEIFSIEKIKTRTPLFLQYIYADVSPHSLYYSIYPTDYYLRQSTASLNIHQIYPEAVSSRAPPSLSF